MKATNPQEFYTKNRTELAIKIDDTQKSLRDLLECFHEFNGDLHTLVGFLAAASEPEIRHGDCCDHCGVEGRKFRLNIQRLAARQ